MKNWIVDMSITHNPDKILHDLQELFIHQIETGRPYQNIHIIEEATSQ